MPIYIRCLSKEILHSYNTYTDERPIDLKIRNTILQINHQPDATIFHFIILIFIYISTCFGRFTAHHEELNDCSGTLWFYLYFVVIVVLCLWSGRPARPQTPHDYYHETKVKPEAATAVIELLMMGGKTPETC
jgi:hypothetical protein